MGKSPSFQLYASDFDMDTASWDNEEVGIYFRLLMYQWVNGGIPSDTKRLAKIVRTSHKKFQKSWEIIKFKFTEKNTNSLINKRMEKTRDGQKAYRENQKNHGLRGVKIKKEKGIYPFKKTRVPLPYPSSNPSRVEQATED